MKILRTKNLKVEPERALSPLKQVLKKELVVEHEWDEFGSISSSLVTKACLFSSSSMRGRVKDDSSSSMVAMID